MKEIDQPISWDELKPAVIKLTKNKVPGLNRVPTNNFKALNDGNLTHLLDFFNKHWMEEIDFDEWNEGQSVPVPKSGDLSDPNKWRGITLMDIGAKIFKVFRMCPQRGKCMHKSSAST